MGHHPPVGKLHFRLSLVMSLLIIGFGIGWLIGLSVSPVVSIVITSVTGTAAAIIAAASGLDEGNRWNVNPLPMALLIIGILAGSSVGIIARNQDWFARDMKVEASRWKNAGLDMEEKDILARLFDNAYPQNGSSTSASGSGAQVRSGTILFSISSDECTRLLAQEGRALAGEMRISDNPSVEKLPDIVQDTAELERIVREVLCVPSE